ncbi:unnamed protein product, partial [Amoebophrya sp. A25]
RSVLGSPFKGAGALYGSRSRSDSLVHEDLESGKTPVVVKDRSITVDSLDIALPGSVQKSVSGRGLNQHGSSTPRSPSTKDAAPLNQAIKPAEKRQKKIVSAWEQESDSKNKDRKKNIKKDKKQTSGGDKRGPASSSLTSRSRSDVLQTASRTSKSQQQLSKVNKDHSTRSNSTSTRSKQEQLYAAGYDNDQSFQWDAPSQDRRPRHLRRVITTAEEMQALRKRRFDGFAGTFSIDRMRDMQYEAGLQGALGHMYDVDGFDFKQRPGTEVVATGDVNYRKPKHLDDRPRTKEEKRKAKKAQKEAERNGTPLQPATSGAGGGGTM